MEKNNYMLVIIVAIVAIVGMITLFTNNTNKIAYVNSGNNVVSSADSAGNIGGQAYKSSPKGMCEELGNDNILNKDLTDDRIKSCINNNICNFPLTLEEKNNLNNYNNCLADNGIAISQEIVYEKNVPNDFTKLKPTKLEIKIKPHQVGCNIFFEW